MKHLVFAIILLLSSAAVNAQCEATAGPDINIGCGDTAWLNVDLYLTKEVSSTTKNLSSLFFVNHDLGFVVGQEGTILKTTDGGVSWTSGTFLPSESWFHVFFIDENTGYIISGSSGKIIKTTDGGNTWS